MDCEVEKGGGAEEMEMITVMEMATNPPLASHSGNNISANPENFPPQARTQENLLLVDELFEIRWVKATIFMAFTALLALFNMTYKLYKGNLFPEIFLAQDHSDSFVIFVLVLMTVFFLAFNVLVFRKEALEIAQACNLAALVGVLLIVTILLWVLLPPSFNLLPWISFVFTSGALLYKCCKPGTSGNDRMMNLDEENRAS